MHQPSQWQGQPVQGQLNQQQGMMMYQPQPNQAPGYFPPQQPSTQGFGVVHPQTEYEYIPHDFRIVTVLTMIFCGVFSPLTFMFTIPALIYARKSQKSAENGSTKEARSQGLVAAYLNITAVIFALVLAIILTGLVIGLHGKTYARDRCLAEASDNGRVPRSAYEYIDPGNSNFEEGAEKKNIKDREKRNHNSRRRISC